MQKYYRPGVGDGNNQRNDGELPRYVVGNSHPAIIDQATFDAVQSELARRRRFGFGATPTSGGNAFTSRIICAQCGRPYYRRTKKLRGKVVKFWWCASATKGVGNPCRSPQIKEELLKNICLDLLNLDTWDEQTMFNTLKTILVSPHRTLGIQLAGQPDAIKIDLSDWKAPDERHRNSAA